MKKIALLLTVITALSLLFTACTASPAGGEETTGEETTASPVNGSEDVLTEDVFSGSEEAQNTTENAEESIFYVG